MTKSKGPVRQKKKGALTRAEFTKNPSSICFEIERVQQELMKWLIPNTNALTVWHELASEINSNSNYLTEAPITDAQIKTFKRILSQLIALFELAKGEGKVSKTNGQKLEKLVLALLKWIKNAGGLTETAMDNAAIVVDIEDMATVKDYIEFRKTVQRYRLVNELFNAWFKLEFDAEDLDL